MLPVTEIPTVWETPAAELPLKLASPAYVAVIVLIPGVLEVRLHPPAVAADEHESVPSETVTLPPGEPAPGESTATAHVTRYDWPTDVGVASAAVLVMVVMVVALLTFCPSANEPLLARKLPSPLYVAV